MSSLEYWGLHEIHTNVVGLDCNRQAQRHVTNMHKTNSIFINDLLDDNKVSHNDDDDNNSSSHDIENFISDEIDIASQCNVANDNTLVDNITLCHRKVSFDNYSEKFRDSYCAKVVIKAMV